MARTRSVSRSESKSAKSYKHPESESPMRPEVGTQAQFKKKLPPKKYRYDDSLSPVLEWDGQNPARERGEARIAKAEAELAEARKKLNGKPETKEAAGHVAAAQKAIGELKAMSRPFLNWAGKAERLSFDVPTLPLFIHERLSTKAIMETLKGHKRDKQHATMFDLFGDPQHSIADQMLRAYEYRDKWVNRMILGDSLVVMNSLLHYENLGGQVQMIYMDPPYGVKFGSNFQPFVRKRDVTHNDDEDMTREPEMVQAYRDTWELGLHSYLTYLRDRLLLARELLAPSGSIFVQISDENLHHVRELWTRYLGRENFCGVISFHEDQRISASGALAVTYRLPAAGMRETRSRAEVSADICPSCQKPVLAGTISIVVELPDGTRRRHADEPGRNRRGSELLPEGARISARHFSSQSRSCGHRGRCSFAFEGQTCRPKTNGKQLETTNGRHDWRLQCAERLDSSGNTLHYRALSGRLPGYLH